MFRLTPMFSVFKVQEDLHEYAVTYPVSLLASAIICLIHLAMVSLDTSPYGGNVAINNPGSEDLVNRT